MEGGVRKRMEEQEDFCVFLIHKMSVSHSQMGLSKRTVSTDRIVGASFPVWSTLGQMSPSAP